MRSWTVLLDSLLFDLPVIYRLALIVALMLLLSFVSRRKGFLTQSGAFAAVLLGTVVMYIGGVSALVILLFFFLSASVISKVSRNADHISAKGSERDMMQVAANGLPAAIALLLFRLSPFQAAALAAFAAAIAEAEADTLSGEIGRLSHNDPLSIITLTRVPKGLSGGVTVLGLAAGAGASLLISLLFLGTFGCDLFSFLAVASSGFLGSVLDSFLGATVQVHYRRKDGSITERRTENGEENERARGIKWIDNDTVNFISGLFASSLAFVTVLLNP